MTTRFIRPRAAGAIIRDPATGQPIPAHGASVAWSSFWQRRWDDGDLEETTEKAIAAAEKKAADAAQTQGDAA